MKHLSLLVLVVSFLFSMISMPGYAENKEEGMRLFDEAEKLRETAHTSADMTKAAEKYGKSLPLFEKAENNEGIGKVFDRLGMIYSARAEYSKALECYEKSLEIFRKINHLSGEGDTLGNMGNVYAACGEYVKAAEYFEKSLEIAQNTGDFKGECNALGNLGSVYYHRGEYTKATEYYEKSLEITRRSGDIRGEGSVLGNLGTVYKVCGEYSKAAEYFEKSLEISRKISNTSGEAGVLSNLGGVHAAWAHYSKAVDYYEQSLAISRKIGNTRFEGMTIGNLGNVYVSLGEYTKAAEYYEKSLEISRKTGDIGNECSVLNNLGNVYMNLGEYSKAAEYYEKSLEISRKTGDIKEEGNTIMNLGSIFSLRGEYTKAEEYFEKSLEISRKTGDVMCESNSLINLGVIYNEKFAYSKAAECYKKSLAIKYKIGDHQGVGNVLSNLGLVYLAAGHYSMSVRCGEAALEIATNIGDPSGEGNALSSLGDIHETKGEYSKAISYYEKSLEIYNKIGDVKGEGQVLGDMGGVYRHWGQYSKAVQCYEKSFDVATKIGDVRGEEKVLNNVALVYSDCGWFAKAMESYKKSLAICRKMGLLKSEGTTLLNLGVIYANKGEPENALEHFQKGLAKFEGSGASFKWPKDLIGNIYLDRGDTAKAEPFLKEAGYDSSLGRLELIKSDYQGAMVHYDMLLQTAQKNRNVNDLFTAYVGVGMACEGLGDDNKAEEYFLKAVDLTEDLRSSLPIAQRETFFDVRISGFRRTDPYDGLARVLIKMKKMPEAFRTSEYTKARLFAESMSRRSDNSSFDIPSEVLEKDRELSDQLAALKKKRQESYEKSDQEVISAIEPQVKTLEENLQTHIKTLRDKYPLFAATKYPEPIDLNQSALKENEWVLEYHVTDTGILIYLTKGKEMVKALFKPLQRDELSKLIVRYRQPLEIVSKRDKFEEKLKSFDLATGKKLFDLLLGDVLDLLPSGASVIIVPDGALGILPFEMLVMNDAGIIKTDKTLPYVSGAEFFGDRNPISYSQSVTALTLTRIHSKRKPSDGGLLVLADPVFVENDKRTAKDTKTEPQSGVLASLYKSLMAGDESDQMGGLQFQRLSRTGELAEALAAMYKKNSAVYTGFAASKSNFFDNISPSLNKFNEVVFATHGYFGKDLPGIMEPVLVLTLVPPGIDGYLRMTEVMGLNMNADIVALTACQTGLGKQISGEGTMGMGRAFQYAGARSVLMSLWSVHEVASMNLIKSFFRNMKEGKNKSDALAAARSEIRQNGFDHPFFWAGFILVGEPQ